MQDACGRSQQRQSLLPPEVIVGQIKVFQREQEIVKSLDGNFD